MDATVGVLADARRATLVGAFAVGPLASEWIHMAVLAVKAQIPLEVLRDTIAQFPTFSEALITAVRELDVWGVLRLRSSTAGGMFPPGR